MLGQTELMFLPAVWNRQGVLAGRHVHAAGSVALSIALGPRATALRFGACLLLSYLFARVGLAT